MFLMYSIIIIFVSSPLWIWMLVKKRKKIITKITSKSFLETIIGLILYAFILIMGYFLLDWLGILNGSSGDVDPMCAYGSKYCN